MLIIIEEVVILFSIKENFYLQLSLVIFHRYPTCNRQLEFFFLLFRDVWIQEEKELLQEVSGMGELREPWHSRQIELLDRHLQLLHLYSQAKENLQSHKGIYLFKNKKEFNFVMNS